MNKISGPQYGDNFVGRGEKINELKEKIENPEIVVITGDRGIGKTNLMLAVKEDMGKEKECHFVNGSLFYEEMDKIFKPPWYKRIHGFSASLIAGGGISWDPMKPFILENMEKSEEKMIFVENAQEMDKKALETIFDGSRRNDRLRFVLEIATPYMPDVKLRVSSYEIVKLDELSDKSIAKIVRKECPNFSDAIVKRIVSLTKGYPYVARSLAYICDRKNAEKEMFEFLETLRDDDMSYNLNKIHKEVLETLNQDSQEVIKRLAIAPTTLTLDLIEAFCVEEVDTPLNDIIERGILMKLEEEEFYQIYHPLFREYLQHIQPIALKNKKELYCEVMEEVKSEFDSIYLLFEVINESDIFKELIELAGNYDVVNYIGLQSYTWGKLDEAICAWGHIREKTKDSDKKWEAIATGNIGNFYQTRGELGKALECLERTLKLHEEQGIKEGIALDYGNIGLVYQTKGELEKALEYFEKALELDKELGRKEGIASDYGHIGLVYQTKGELEKALEYFEKALELDEELGRKEGIADQLKNIGLVYQTKGELEKALGCHEKALELDEELGTKEGMARNLGNIGIVYTIRAELDKALEYLKKALKLNEELGRKEGIAKQLGNIGSVYQLKGELEKALVCHEKALELDEELGTKEGMATDYGNIGGVYQLKGELDKALEYFEKALGIFKVIGSGIQTVRTLIFIGDVFVLKHDKERALDYYLEAQELAIGSSVFEYINDKINKLLGANKNAKSDQSD